MHHILSVDDDYRIRELLFDYLTSNGFYVNTVVSVQEAEQLLELFFFDLIILDIMMPGEDGISFLQRMRAVKSDKIGGLASEGLASEGLASEGLVGESLASEGLVGKNLASNRLASEGLVGKNLASNRLVGENSAGKGAVSNNSQNINYNNNKNNIPVLLLSARGEVEHRIGGLEKGADEYLPKPFEPRELLLRIKNILKRAKNNKIDNIVRFGEFSFNLNKMILKQSGNFVFLNEVEKKLMKLLVKKNNTITNRDELAKLLKSTNPRSVDVSIGRLRQKIEKDPKTPQFLQTIRGSGYILNTGENYYNENVNRLR